MSKVLIACEFSGKVRRAFPGSWSCDLEPSDDGSDHHIVGDVLDVMGEGWDMVIAFPPCTHLCSSGARWWAEKAADGRQQEAIDFFMEFTRLSCPWAIENPIGLMSTVYRKPDQIIQPWQFGHGETKSTCLWLNGLPPLNPTDIVAGRRHSIHRMSSSWSRQRSITYDGIAAAMGEQWNEQRT